MSIQLNQVRTESAFRLVERTIEENILSGAVSPGDQLPSEASLAEQLGVNRSTVREAIRLLEQNGFVRREAGKKKLFVSIPQSSDISKRLTAAMVLHQVTFEELWETMVTIEPATADAAARRADDTDCLAIEANLEATRQAIADSASLTELDIEFHELIAQAARNRALLLSRQALSDLFYPPFYAVMKGLNAGQRLLAAHENIYRGIKEHDAPFAREWMEKHIHDFRRGYELANLDMASPVDLPSMK